MKKYTVLILVIVIIILSVFIFYNKIGYIFPKRAERIVNIFEIPTENVPTCYPIEMVDYREVNTKDDQLMVFGRTVWSNKINNNLSGKPAVVPLEIFAINNETGEPQPLKRGFSSPDDGHIVFMIENPEERYLIKIDFKNAKNCPEEFKYLEEKDIINSDVF